MLCIGHHAETVPGHEGRDIERGDEAWWWVEEEGS